MKALVKVEAAKGVWLKDVPEPAYGINDVLVRVRKTSICGTDVHIYSWNAWAQRTIRVPMTIGHEWVGEIEAVGSNVTDKQPGELVSGEGHIVCGLCRNCLAGGESGRSLRRVPRDPRGEHLARGSRDP